ncbi:uncharacterized protein BO80DRAFT_445984 [Aspergillus ibericus CBS 121593]|uniref:Uncharacterized protein n=1 Tax=Aspergillus ibericus CBS 121593 TaxID=1448316 RepID=A0A395GY28_9EURO|nr:hypothetical protein BO80DRAFT_445984 [Aspergillus ibericus CBS 121593]RAK99968.1 hypothetical protein BO80DRAFT_445984 [Aspergillus ibericus CBS 121593]
MYDTLFSIRDIAQGPMVRVDQGGLLEPVTAREMLEQAVDSATEDWGMKIALGDFTKSDLETYFGRGKLDLILLTVLSDFLASFDNDQHPALRRSEELNMQYETKLEGSVYGPFVKVHLDGRTDYTVFHGPPADFKANFVYVEAKREGTVSCGEYELLSAMALVQRKR